VGREKAEARDGGFVAFGKSSTNEVPKNERRGGTRPRSGRGVGRASRGVAVQRRRTSCSSFMNLSIVSSAFCSSDGRSREGEGWVRVVDARARRRAIASNAPVASGRRFVDARQRALSASSTHLAGNGERSVHIEQGEGLPGLLALRHGAFLTRACCGCDFDATDVLFRHRRRRNRTTLLSASRVLTASTRRLCSPTRRPLSRMVKRD
jgi:hypothetical protein